jgi:hypothetical protein
MATDVHEALKTLSPIEHIEFPSDPSALDAHLVTSLADVHTLISSIPPPAILPKSLNLPEPPNMDTEALQKEWKPVKLSNKENQIGISVFKLSAKDGKGTWFARRSIHTNISFDRFKAGLQYEFKEKEKPGPVRGIGRDVLVRHESSELGRGEILQLSAQFPGPSAPRDFVEGCLSSSAHPEDHSSRLSDRTDSNSGGGGEGTAKDRPRQFTLISKPVLNHPECDQRSGYVRGTYESVEFIREIPITPKSLARCHSTPNVPSVETPASPTRPRGKTIGQIADEVTEAVENCPVDWIMITRSDPGGSVPRWMVERGTPGGIVKDAEKFLTALLTIDTISEQLAKGRKTSQESSKLRSTPQLAERKDLADAVLTVEQAKAELSPTVASSTILNPVKEQNITGAGGGLLSSAINSMAIGMTSLAQSMVSSSNPTPPPTSSSDDETPSSHGTASDASLDDTDDDGAETASIKTFATCDSSPDLPIPEPPSRTPSVASTMTTSNQTPEERALAQFLKEKQKLDEKLKKEENRLTERERKIADKHLKNMEKQERKYCRSLEKANEKRQKEEEKRERDVQKKLEKEEKGRRKETEELKKIVEGLTRENLALRQRIEDLEKERDKEKEAAPKATAEKVAD